MTVTEATKRHVKDRTLAIKARERELDQREAKITRRSESLDAAVDRVRGVVRDFDEQHVRKEAELAKKEAEQARKEADVRAREDVNHNEQERLAAEAKRLAQVKRDLTADRMFLEHGGRAEVERKQRLKAEAELAEYRRIADPLIEAARPEPEAKRQAQAREARIREDEEDERLVRKHKLAQEREQRREARQREQANKRRGVLSLITPQRGKDGGIGRERER